MSYQCDRFYTKKRRSRKPQSHIWKFCMWSPPSQNQNHTVNDLLIEVIYSIMIKTPPRLRLTFSTQNWWSIVPYLMPTKDLVFFPEIVKIFLETLMACPEYMRIHSKYFSLNIWKLYGINSLIDIYWYVYIKIVRGMYGLKQSDIIAYNQLVKYMDNYGYFGPLLMLHEIVSMTSVLNIITSMNQIISSPLFPNIMQSPYIGVEITSWYYLLIGIMKKGALTFLCLTIYQRP